MWASLVSQLSKLVDLMPEDVAETGAEDGSTKGSVFPVVQAQECLPAVADTGTEIRQTVSRFDHEADGVLLRTRGKLGVGQRQRHDVLPPGGAR
jgi:hypothetical protein